MDEWSNVRTVQAKRRIEDNPLSSEDHGVKRGTVGSIEDIADGFLWVDFGEGTIPCEPDEVKPFSSDF